jgi:hypothetical protein
MLALPAYLIRKVGVRCLANSALEEIQSLMYKAAGGVVFNFIAFRRFNCFAHGLRRFVLLFVTMGRRRRRIDDPL